MQANENGKTILAEREEETFEFGAVKQLPDGRVLSNVRNNSHDEPGEHVYPVFFDVAQDDTIIGAHVAECGCPADEYHDGKCKHREAASECGELLGRVLEAALGGEDDSKEEQDAHATAEAGESGQTVATDGGEPPEDCVCDKLGGLPCFSCVMNGRKTLTSEEGDEEIRTDGGQLVEDEHEDDLETVLWKLTNHHNSALVVIHDEATEHVGFWDKSKRDVAAMTLDYMQDEGFQVIQAGVRRCNETGDKRAWAEFRRETEESGR